MLEESNRGKKEKDKEEIRVANEDDYRQDESPRKKRRLDKRKREKEESLEDIHLKIFMAKTMGELELEAVELVKDMEP